MEYLPEIHRYVFKLLLQKYGEGNVLGTGSLHPNLRDFSNKDSDLDIIVNTLDPLEKIKLWIERKFYQGMYFQMVVDKVYWNDRHIADVIPLCSKNFPRKHISENGLSWVTPKRLLAEYRFHDESGKSAEKIKFLEKLCGGETRVLNLTSNSPVSGNKRKRGPDSGNELPPNGDKSPKSGGNSIVKTLF